MTDEHNAQNRVTDEMVNAACQAQAIEIARQDGVALTPSGFRHGANSRPEEHELMRAYVRRGLEAALSFADGKVVRWIEWTGGDFLPVPPEMLVTVLLRDGSVEGPSPSRDFGGEESCWKHRGTDGDIVAYTSDLLFAAPASPPAPPVSDGKVEPVKVKPLEWSDAIHGGWVALGAAGVYHIYQYPVDQTTIFEVSNPFNHDNPHFSTRQEAESAAQADYEQRILSALASPARHICGEEVERLRAALTEARDKARIGQCHGLSADGICEEIADLADAALQRDAQGGGE